MCDVPRGCSQSIRAWPHWRSPPRRLPLGQATWPVRTTRDAQIVKHRHLLGRIKQLNTLRRLAKFVRHSDEHAEKVLSISLQSVRSRWTGAAALYQSIDQFLEGDARSRLARPVIRTTALLPRSATNNRAVLCQSNSRNFLHF